MGRVCRYGTGYAIYDKSGKRITKKIPTLREARYVNHQLQLEAQLDRRKLNKVLRKRRSG